MALRALVPDAAVPLARKAWFPLYGTALYWKGRLKGRTFSARAPHNVIDLRDRTSQPPPEPNDLEQFFDARDEGPGIWKWRHYFPIYERHFARFRNRPVRIVEVGIYSGGSLDMWQEYFGAECEIIGIDIEDDCRVYARDGVEVVIGNQADRSFWSQFREAVGPVDIIVDDGGHMPLQQLVTLEEILGHLRPGGVYLCEDIYGDSNPFLYYLAGLSRSLHGFEIDDTNNGDLDSNGIRPNAFQALVQSIHMYPFAAVIETHPEPIDNFISPRKGTQWQPWMAQESRPAQLDNR